MKRFLAVILAGFMLVGCGGAGDVTEEENTTAEAVSEETTEEETEEETEEATEEETVSETEEQTTAQQTTAAAAEAPVPAETKAPEPATEAAPKTVASCGEIYSSCVSGAGFAELVALDSDYMFNYYGIDVSSLADFAAGEALDVTNADTLMIFNAGDSSKAEEVKAKLVTYKERKIEELKNYNPAQCTKVEAGIIGVKGNYAYIVICDNPSNGVKIIEGLI